MLIGLLVGNNVVVCSSELEEAAMHKETLSLDSHLECSWSQRVHSTRCQLATRLHGVLNLEDLDSHKCENVNLHTSVLKHPAAYTSNSVVLLSFSVQSSVIF